MRVNMSRKGLMCGASALSTPIAPMVIKPGIRIDVAKLRTNADRSFAARCSVFVDGLPVKYVLVADEQMGYVDKYMQLENGELQMVGGDPVKERITGDVRIEAPSRG